MLKKHFSLAFTVQRSLSKIMENAFDSINGSLTKNAGSTHILSDALLLELLKPIHALTYPYIIIGVFTDTVNILIFWILDFSAVSNISLFSLSIADLINLMFMANSLICDNPFFTLEVFMPRLHFSLISNPLHYSVMAFSSWIPAVISMERRCCIMLPMKVRS